MKIFRAKCISRMLSILREICCILTKDNPSSDDIECALWLIQDVYTELCK